MPPALEFRPLIVNDGEADRHLTWASRDDGLPHLPEGEPRRLFETFIGLCDTLRGKTNREPQFDAPNDIRHEIVWGADAGPPLQTQAPRQGGRQGTAVLVLTNNRAQARPERVANAAPPEIEAVDQQFPSRSGLQAEIEAAGFRLRWVREEDVARRREQGWDTVVVEPDGRRVAFKVRPACRPSIRLRSC